MIRHSLLLVATLCLALSIGACGHDPAGPPPPEAELTVLFVGNSLTYSNDVPGLVQTIAEATGHTLLQFDRSAPNFSLEDHWNTGVANEIAASQADFVIMQQGPSSLPESQEYLEEWTETLSETIYAVGARPALYMVWPDRSRLFAFDAVRQSYSAAAAAVNGMFIPAGEAWRSAWARDPLLGLYGPDDFHPSDVGSVLAALTIYRMLFGEDVRELPARLEPTTNGLPIIDLGDELALLLFEAVEEAVAQWGRP